MFATLSEIRARQQRLLAPAPKVVSSSSTTRTTENPRSNVNSQLTPSKRAETVYLEAMESIPLDWQSQTGEPNEGSTDTPAESAPLSSSLPEIEKQESLPPVTTAELSMDFPAAMTVSTVASQEVKRQEGGVPRTRMPSPLPVAMTETTVASQEVSKQVSVDEVMSEASTRESVHEASWDDASMDSAPELSSALTAATVYHPAPHVWEILYSAGIHTRAARVVRDTRPKKFLAGPWSPASTHSVCCEDTMRRPKLSDQGLSLTERRRQDALARRRELERKQRKNRMFGRHNFC